MVWKGEGALSSLAGACERGLGWGKKKRERGGAGKRETHYNIDRDGLFPVKNTNFASPHILQTRRKCKNKLFKCLCGRAPSKKCVPACFMLVCVCVMQKEERMRKHHSSLSLSLSLPYTRPPVREGGPSCVRACVPHPARQETGVPFPSTQSYMLSFSARKQVHYWTVVGTRRGMECVPPPPSPPLPEKQEQKTLLPRHRE